MASRLRGWALDTLRDDGWAMVAQPNGALLACHRDVPDEAAARRRLHDLGLLTSQAVQIRFRAAIS